VRRWKHLVERLRAFRRRFAVRATAEIQNRAKPGGSGKIGVNSGKRSNALNIQAANERRGYTHAPCCVGAVDAHNERLGHRRPALDELHHGAKILSINDHRK
jgi:hypothetical protein